MTQDDTATEDTRTDQSASDESAQQAPDRGIFLPLIFGGAVATALGFFGAQIDSIEAALGLAPEETDLTAVVEAQEAAISEQFQKLAALEVQIAEIPEPEIPDPVDISGLEATLAEQATQIAGLSARIEDLEKRPMTEGLSEDAVAAYESELLRLQEAVAEQRSEIEALLSEARDTESEAEQQARLALARAATARVIAAVESGAPYTDALTELQSAGDVDLPAVLSNAADSGVATLAELQSGFPPAARAALRAARAAENEAGSGGLGAFLQRQLGARSVTPQEGDGADAVLSRAEAAVIRGDLDTALDELAALAEPGRVAMSDWIDRAETRREAVTAANTLMSEISTN